MYLCFLRLTSNTEHWTSNIEWKTNIRYWIIFWKMNVHFSDSPISCSTFDVRRWMFDVHFFQPSIGYPTQKQLNGSAPCLRSLHISFQKTFCQNDAILSIHAFLQFFKTVFLFQQNYYMLNNFVDKQLYLGYLTKSCIFIVNPRCYF